jgi:hypothetical protein
MNAENNSTVLVGWKEIAKAVSTSISTAKRWAETRGLPVYKVEGRVRANQGDVQKWLDERSEPWVKSG